LRRELAAARAVVLPAAVASLRAELTAACAELASPRSSDDEESPAVASLKRELEAARAALTDQRLRGDPAENDAVARLREALGRKDDQLEVLEDEVSRCRADVERRRGVEEELRRELLAKTSSTPPSGAKLLRTLAHDDAESADLEDDADGDVEALERELEEAQETISSLEAAADEAQRTIETLETAAAQDEAALEAYPEQLEAAQDDAAAARADCSAARQALVAAQDEALEARRRTSALEDEIKAMRAEAAKNSTLHGERDEARRSLDECQALLGQARGAETKAKDDLAALEKVHEDLAAAQATDSLRVGRLEAALEQHGTDLVEATANAARAEGALARKADEVKRLEAIIRQREQDAVEANERFEEILVKRDADDRGAVERLQACLRDRDAETARVLDQAKATEAHSLKLRETLSAAEANATAYTAKYHLLEASTSAGSARVRAIEERMTAQEAAVAALSDERDRAVGELRKARDAALEATPLALAGSRRDNASLRRALQEARAEVQSLRRRPPQVDPLSCQDLLFIAAHRGVSATTARPAQLDEQALLCGHRAQVEGLGHLCAHPAPVADR
jgi:chromosome segregation ATPase